MLEITSINGFHFLYHFNITARNDTIIGQTVFLDQVVYHLTALFLFDLNVHTDFSVHILAGVIREIVVQALLLVEKFENLS